MSTDSPRRRFVSTRGGVRYTWRESVLAGWAGDGGMILPETLPSLTRERLASWRGECEISLIDLSLSILILTDSRHVGAYATALIDLPNFLCDRPKLS
jgi:threonine synthase